MTGAQIAPQVLVQSDMSLALAQQLLRGVRDAASGGGTSVAAAVVDRSGRVVAAARHFRPRRWPRLPTHGRRAPRRAVLTGG